MMEDEEYYRRYLAGDEAAAEALVEAHADALVLYLNSYLRDLHDAEDLMIEAFARVFARERPIRSKGSFRAYLYRTARNLALRQLRRKRLTVLAELSFEPRSEALAETALLRDEQARQLYLALDKLKPEYREALYLVFFEDMRYRDAAAVMGKTEAQITKLIYRGKKSLRALLDREGFTYDQ